MVTAASLRTRLVHPVVLVLIGIASVQIGATFAKSLFDEVTPTAMVWLRLSLSALILLAITRPRIRGLARRDWLVVLAFGASLGMMNWTIYQAFARLPIGIAVTIEFIGPLTIALVSSRRARDLVWVALAAAGVVLLGLEPGPISIVGVLFALAAGACWESYIVLSKATGARWEGLDGLALASTVAAVALTPAAMAYADGIGSPHVWLVGLMVGLMSSVVPYSLDLVALRSIKPSLYAILMSLEPAAGALAAIVVLHEGLSLQQWLAIVCVVIASAGATTTGKPEHHVPAESTPA